jgi:hypothetical protein
MTRLGIKKNNNNYSMENKLEKCGRQDRKPVKELFQ